MIPEHNRDSNILELDVLLAAEAQYLFIMIITLLLNVALQKCAVIEP